MHCCENRFWKDGTATVRIYNLARIAGVNLPTHKRVPIALTYITGIGPASADKICEGTKIDAARRINELSDAEILSIRCGLIRFHLICSMTSFGDLMRAPENTPRTAKN